MYVAPRAISRRLVISARPTLPTPPASSPESSSVVVHQNPPRPRHPPELLKHRFAPLGSLAPVEDSAEMDVDGAPASVAQPVASKPQKSKKTEVGEGSKKKRKGDAESPKKTKKAKAAS